MKFLFVAAALALFGSASSTNSTWGTVGPYDVLIHHSIRRKEPSFWRVVTEDFRFPISKQKNNRTITAIRVTDQIPKSKAFAQIYAGGVGYNNTLIHFKSQRNQGFNFNVEIFVKP